MTPAATTFDIYKGARFEHTLTLRDEATGDPLDLSGLTPFVMTASHPVLDQELFTFSTVVATPASGVVVISATPTQTDALTVSTKIRYGMRDSLGDPYLAGVMHVKFFAPPAP